MEFFFVASSVIKGMNIYEATQFREGFFNVDATEYPNGHGWIMFIKCLVAACGMIKLPEKVSLAVLGFNFLKSFIFEVDFYGVLISLFVSAAAAYVLLPCNDDAVPIFNTIMLFIGSNVHGPVEFFVDAYIIAMFYAFLYQIYGRELDKLFTMICFLYCVDWILDYSLGGDTMGVIHAVINVHLVILLCVLLAPADSKSLKRFCVLVSGLAVWVFYRLATAAWRNGVTDNKYFVLNATREAFENPKEKIYARIYFDNM